MLIARASSTCVRPRNLLSAVTSPPDLNSPRINRFRTRAGIALENCALVSSGMSVISAITTDGNRHSDQLYDAALAL